MHGLFSSFIEELIRSQRGPTLWADSATGSSMVTYDDVYVALCEDGCLLRESSGKRCVLPTPPFYTRQRLMQYHQVNIDHSLKLFILFPLIHLLLKVESSVVMTAV